MRMQLLVAYISIFSIGRNRLVVAGKPTVKRVSIAGGSRQVTVFSLICHLFVVRSSCTAFGEEGYSILAGFPISLQRQIIESSENILLSSRFRSAICPPAVKRIAIKGGSR